MFSQTWQSWAVAFKIPVLSALLSCWKADLCSWLGKKRDKYELWKSAKNNKQPYKLCNGTGREANLLSTHFASHTKHELGRGPKHAVHSGLHGRHWRDACWLPLPGNARNLSISRWDLPSQQMRSIAIEYRKMTERGSWHTCTSVEEKVLPEFKSEKEGLFLKKMDG